MTNGFAHSGWHYGRHHTFDKDIDFDNNASENRFFFSTPSFFMAILRCFGSGLLSTNVGQDKVELILFVLQIVLLTLCGLFKRNCTLFSLFVLFLQMK